MSSEKFHISVIIPVFNCREYIGEAIESVLGQTFPPMEIIVVDDGSTDGTHEVVNKYKPRIKYIHQPNQGAAKARNTGVQESGGDYLAHLDADDVWLKEKLKLQMEAFSLDKDLEIVGAHMLSFFTPGLAPEIKNKIYCPPDPIPGFSASTIVVKRESFFRVGWYETQWKNGQDLDWFIRAREIKLKEAMIPEVLALRRLHTANSGIIQPQSGKNRLQILKESLDRRRKISQDLAGKTQPMNRTKK